MRRFLFSVATLAALLLLPELASAQAVPVSSGIRRALHCPVSRSRRRALS